MVQTVDIVTRFLADTSDLEKGAGQGVKAVEGFGHSIDVGGIAKMAAFAGGATLAAGAIIEMTSAASKDAAEQAKLETAIAAAGAAHGDYAAQVDLAIAAGQAKAFTDTETRAGLESLVTATGSVTDATALLATAQDVARFAGVDLATASDAVAKAQAGNATQLSRLIPGLEKGATASDTLANAQKAAAGQADTFAKTTEGQMAVASDAFSELGETIGSAFLPILEALLPALVPIIKSLGQLVQAILPILIPLLSTLGKVLAVVAGVLATVVGWIAGLVKGLSDAIGKVGDFLSSLNPLKGLSLPSLPFLSSAALAPVPAGRSGGRGARSSFDPFRAGGSIVVNVSGADPESVVRALRRWTAANGGVPSLNRTLTRAGA